MFLLLYHQLVRFRSNVFGVIFLLSVDSAIDCNKAVLKPESYFTTKQYFKICKPINNSKVINKIKEAIRKSNIVEDRIKTLL